VRNLQELFDDPQLGAREMIARVEHATIGQLRTLGVPVKLSETPGAVITAPPMLGQHTDAVLARDLGFNAEAIAALRRSRSSSNEQLAIATGCSLLVARCSMSVPEGSEHASETEGHHIAMEIADVRKRLVRRSSAQAAGG